MINGFKVVKKSLNQFKLLVSNLNYRLRYGKHTGNILYIRFDPTKIINDGKYHQMTARLDNVKITPIQNWHSDYNIFEAVGKFDDESKIMPMLEDKR